LAPRYVTYFGGSHIDGVLSIVGDGSGSAYFAGVSFSADMLTTPGAFQESTVRITDDQVATAGRDYFRMSTREPREGYFGVLSPDGTTVRHGTYLSGFYNAPRAFDALSIASTVARTPAGTVYVGGSTDAESFPTTDGGFRPRMSGTADGFVTEWKPQSFHISTDTLLPVAEMDGGPYMARLEASGGTGPLQWQVVGGFRLVEGLSLSADGVISGSARQAFDVNGAGLTEVGAYQFTAKAIDAAGAVAYKSFFLPTRFEGHPKCANGTCTLQVRLGNELPLYPPRIPNRAQPPLTLNVTGTLPPGTALDANGEFRGRTITAGRYLVTLGARDALGKSVALTWDFDVVDPNPPPVPSAPAPTPPATGASSGGGGGGGQADMASLGALLLALLCASLRSARRARSSSDERPSSPTVRISACRLTSGI
jgi:hypothetical protein